MPFIPLAGDSLTLPSAVTIVGAVMLWPTDEERRNAFILSAKKKTIVKQLEGLGRQGGGAGFEDVMRWLQESPTADEGQLTIVAALPRGAMVGELLLRELRIRLRLRGEELLPPDDSILHVRNAQNAWDEFKHVAHLWAAHLALGQQESSTFPCTPDKLPELLATAEAFAERALTPTTVRTGYGALVSAAAIWRTPPHVHLPQVHHLLFHHSESTSPVVLV